MNRTTEKVIYLILGLVISMVVTGGFDSREITDKLDECIASMDGR